MLEFDCPIGQCFSRFPTVSKTGGGGEGERGRKVWGRKKE